MERFVGFVKKVGRILARPIWPSKAIYIPAAGDDRVTWLDIVFGGLVFFGDEGCLLAALAAALGFFVWLAKSLIF